MTHAETEYYRVRHLAAFNVNGATRRRTVNQHMREYHFADGSILRVYRSGKASAARGTGDFQTTVIGTIQANAFGR